MNNSKVKSVCSPVKGKNMVNLLTSLEMNIVTAGTIELAIILISEVLIVYTVGFAILNKICERDEYT